jgi:homoserine dehydrogenase
LSLRQVPRVRRSLGGWIGRVSFESMAREHPLAIAMGEWNALLLTQKDGCSVRVVGRGAGRWPTTEAVMADLLEAHRENGAAQKERKPGSRMTLGVRLTPTA